MSMCRHCQSRPVNRPRGLCWGCYYSPGIREQYPSTSKFARRGEGVSNFKGPVPLARVPTAALPGTPEKVATLADRARNMQSLFHPLDANHERPAIKIEVLQLQAG